VVSVTNPYDRFLGFLDRILVVTWPLCKKSNALSVTGGSSVGIVRWRIKATELSP
jgi:hypothetical protein